jgi:restriction endonuclease S subunit
MSKPIIELNPRWKVWRFDQIATNVNDRIDNPSESGLEHYVGLEHLDPGTLKISRWGSPDDVEATKLIFKQGDVIFGRRRAYQRKLGVAEFDGICSAHAMVLRAKPEVVLPEFFPFFLQSDVFMDKAIEISVGSLSPTINWKTLAAQAFPIPHLELQRTLVAKLQAAEDVTKSSVELLGWARLLLKSMVRDQLAVIEAGPQLTITSLGVAGVDVLRTGPFGSNLKSSYFTPTGVPVLSIGSLGEDGIVESELFHLPEEIASRFDEYRVVTGDVVFSRVADVGRCHLVSSNEAGWIISSNLIRIRVNTSRILPEFLILLLKHSRQVRDQISQVTTQAAGRLLVNTRTLARVKFPTPSIQEQESFVHRAGELIHAVNLSRRRVEAARSHKNAILSILFARGDSSVQ